MHGNNKRTRRKISKKEKAKIMEWMVRRTSLRPKIIELAAAGVTVGEIAKQLNCSHVNVSNTIKRAGIRWLHIAPLSPEKANWLLAEARQSNVDPSTLARAMLIDAIEEEMTKCNSTTP